MKKMLIYFLLIYFPASVLFAGGKKEEEIKTNNNEWVLCMTSFDVSALPPSSRIIGDIFTRDLYNALKKVDRRYRDDDEIIFYEDYAWAKARTAAAKALATKRNERDQLLYQGEADWKYRKNLKTRDADIEKLEEAFIKVDTERPLVSRDPVFRFVTANQNGTWPAPPAPGGEYRFCLSQKADAFISGSLSTFHGRILLQLQMYTFHTNSYSYEDMIVFSQEHIQEAFDELSGRIFAAVLGASPAELAVHVNPDDAIVLIDGSLAAFHDVVLRDHAPGKKEIEVYKDNYIPVRFPIELAAGELTDIHVNLTPLALYALTVDVPGNDGSNVYLGGQYLGVSPLMVKLTRNVPSYITIETPDGDTGTSVLHGGRITSGNAEYSEYSGDTIVFNYSTPVNPNEKRVHNAKMKFYGAYGRFWIALPLTMIITGMADNYIDSYNLSSAPTPDLHNKAVNASYVNIGAYVVLGAAIADLAYRLVRYLYISRTDADPLARFPDAGDTN